MAVALALGGVLVSVVTGQGLPGAAAATPLVGGGDPGSSSASWSPGAINRTPTGGSPSGGFSATSGGAGLGVQGFYGLETFALAEGTTAQVNLANGNLVLRQSDLAGVDRFYNSLASGSGMFGSRMVLAGGRDVGGHYTSGTSGAITFQAPSGFTGEFVPNGSGGYTPPAGFNADLAGNGDGSFTLTYRRSGRAVTFSPGGLLVRDADRNNLATVYRYNPDDTLASSTDAVGRVTSYAYQGGQVSQVTDPAGRTSTYGYAGSLLTSVTGPAGGVTRYGYDDAGRLVGIGTARGSVTTFGYDSAGRIATVNRMSTLGATSGDAATTTFTYNSSGGASSTSTVQMNPLGNSTTYTLDGSGRVTGTTDPLGRSRASTYTPNGDVATAADAMGVGGAGANLTRYSYDTRNNPSMAAIPTGAAARAAYAGGFGCTSTDTSHPDLVKCLTDPAGNSTALGYDQAGNVTSSKDSTPSGAGAVTSTVARQGSNGISCGGLAGQACAVTDGRGKTTSYRYDSDGNLVQVTPPGPLGDTLIGYDGLGRATSVRDGNGQTTGYAYDKNDHLVKTSYPDGSTLTSSYDTDGDQTAEADSAAGTTSYSYDALNRQTAVRPPNATADLSLSLDKAGNTLSSTEPNGTTTYGYDTAGELTWLAEPGSSCPAGSSTASANCTRFGYDNNGNRTSTSYPGGVVQSTTRDASGRAARIRAVNAGGAVLSDLAWTYSAAGQSGSSADRTAVQTRTDSRGLAGTPAGTTTTYGYDSLSRLTSAADTTGGAAYASWAYSYDPAGNRTGVSRAGQTGAPAGTTSWGYNDANQLVSTNNDSTGWSYDRNGNQTGSPGNPSIGVARRTASHNARDQVASVTATDSAGAATTLPLAYAGAGNTQLLSAGTGTGRYDLRTNLTGITGLTSQGQTTNFARTPAGEPVALRTPGSPVSLYYLTDNLGSVVGLVNTTGNIVAEYTYDPNGATRAKNGPYADTNPFRWIGGLMEPNTGLYKLGARYYDPSTGRFTQTDPTGQDPHYTYAGNDPINNLDPDGTFGFALAALLPIPGVGEFVAAAAGVVVVTYVVVKAVDAAGTYLNEEHTKGARPSTSDDHQKGQGRAKTDGPKGEKKQQNGRYKPNPNKRQGRR